MEMSENEFMPKSVKKQKTTLVEGRRQTILQELVNIFIDQYLVSLRNRKTIHRQVRMTVNLVPQVEDSPAEQFS